MPRTLLFVVNDGPFFLSHRLALAVAARDAGYQVHVATPDGPAAATVRASGLVFHTVPIDRRSMNPWNDLASLRALLVLYRSLRPDIVHHVTLKPVLYGGAAARLAGVPAVVSAVTGLGYLFISRSATGFLLRPLVKAAYRLALRGPRTRVIFQNPDDRDMFERQGLVRAGDAVLIRGAGVDMNEFMPRPEPSGTPVVMLASRMLYDKGVGEFVEAARVLRSQGVQARFLLVGDTDPDNPTGIAVEQLQAWQREGVVEWLGRRGDMAAVFAGAHVACLPSYREGLPKVLVEAAACGRALVATDVPGCREIARRGDNALLVPPRDAAALAQALRRLVEDAPLRQHMGQRSREIAVAEFSLERVIGQTLGVYRDLLS